MISSWVPWIFGAFLLVNVAELVRDLAVQGGERHSPLPAWVHEELAEFDFWRQTECFYCKAPSLLTCRCDLAPSAGALA